MLTNAIELTGFFQFCPSRQAGNFRPSRNKLDSFSHLRQCGEVGGGGQRGKIEGQNLENNREDGREKSLKTANCTWSE